MYNPFNDPETKGDFLKEEKRNYYKTKYEFLRVLKIGEPYVDEDPTDMDNGVRDVEIEFRTEGKYQKTELIWVKAIDGKIKLDYRKYI